MFDELKKAIEVKADYIDVRLVRSITNEISLREKEVESAVSGQLTSFGVRVLNNGSWGFAVSNDLTKINEVVSSALRFSKASEKHSKKKGLAEVPVIKDSVLLKPKKKITDYSLEEKVLRCKEVVPDKTSDSRYLDAELNYFLVTSEGTEIQFSPTKTFYGITTYEKNEGEILSSYNRSTGLIGYELMDEAEKLVEGSLSKLKLLKKAVRVKPGKSPAVIDYKMAGVLAHECIGHASEADAIINSSSLLKDKKGLSVGPENISISDGYEDKTLFGYYPYDDEGVKKTKTKLIEKGFVKDFINSRETAFELNDAPTGNARAESPSHFPLVRMSTTYFEKGDASFEEILAEVKNGVFVVDSTGGQTDPVSGFFQFASKYGYEIVNGELGKPLRPITMSGNILETLNQITLLENNLTVDSPGFCGKGGQSVAVTDGGSSIALKEMLLG